MGAEGEQLAVTGYDEIGPSGDSGRDDVIVVRIGADHGRNRKRRHQIDDIDIVGEHLSSGKPQNGKTLRWHGSGQNLGQFLQEHDAGKELHLLPLPNCRK